MSDHPALDTVYWVTVPMFKGEFACYRRQSLYVRHTGLTHEGFPAACVGYVNGRHVANRDNMPKICNVLFREIDRMVEA